MLHACSVKRLQPCTGQHTWLGPDRLCWQLSRFLACSDGLLAAAGAASRPLWAPSRS